MTDGVRVVKSGPDVGYKLSCYTSFL